jgi:glycosyltransferase involved in cell wall biosynthesis
VRQGGKPYDIRGCHITETVNEIAVLSRFNRASASRIVEGVTQELITEAQAYYQTLRENLKHMASTRGYAKYFESWHPATISEQEGVVDNIKTLFIEQSIDSRIEAALPLLAKIQQRGQEMKEADIFVQHSIIDPETGDEEGLPVAILEAMASSLPVVSTYHAGIPEAVNHDETGLLVEEGNSKKMAEYLVTLARDADLRNQMGQAAWQRAQLHFSWQLESKQLRQLMGL